MFQEPLANTAGSLRRPAAAEQTPERAHQCQLTASRILILLCIC
jgi:hypothetical protein